jgi:hypothetical protein
LVIEKEILGITLNAINDAVLENSINNLCQNKPRKSFGAVENNRLYLDLKLIILEDSCHVQTHLFCSYFWVVSV